MSNSFEITFTPISVSDKHNKSVIYYNQLVDANVWQWSDGKYNKAKKGDYFAFYFHNEKIWIHEIIDLKGPEHKFPTWDYTFVHERNVLMLSPPLYKITWNEWETLNGPQCRMGTYTTKDLKKARPSVYNYLLSKKNGCKTPSAKIISDYISELISLDNEYGDLNRSWLNENDDPKVPHHSLWWIIYCWDYVNLTKAFNRRKKLLLSRWTHNNNSNKYPKRILKDFREIAMEYDIWNDYINDKYEKDLNTGKIERYCSGNKMKENSVILDNKLIKWEYYEKTKHPI